MRLVDPDVAELLRNSLIKAFRRIIDAAIENEVDLVTVGGDVYDSADHGLHSMILFNDQMKRLVDAGIPCCIVAGNHDPLKKRRLLSGLPKRCHLFGENPERIRLETKNGRVLNVYGVSYGVSAVTENLAEKIIRVRQEDQEKAGLNVALLHCNVGGDARHENYSPCMIGQLKNSGFDAWLLGHVHERKILSESDPLILYPGNIQGRHVREAEERGACLVTFHENGAPNTEFLPVSSVLWQTGETVIDDLDDLYALMNRLDQDFDRLADSESLFEPDARVVRWTLSGRGPLHHEIGRQGIASIADLIQDRRKGIAPKIIMEQLIDDTDPTLDIDEIRRQDSFPAMVVGAADSLLLDDAQKSAINEKISEMTNHASLRKLFSDPLDTLRNDPDVFRRLVQKGMLHALDALNEGRKG
jgi:DNA repair exonuclease SbcCD nuclease subunit